MGVYTGFILGLSWVYTVYTLSGSLYWVYPGFILGLYCLYFEWEFIRGLSWVGVYTGGVYTGFILGLYWAYTLSGSLYWVYPGFILFIL